MSGKAGTFQRLRPQWFCGSITAYHRNDGYAHVG
jgi:hypothetical protein